MPNAFTRIEVATFDEVIGGFEDALVASKAAVQYRTDQTDMARTGDIIWRPYSYIMTSSSGVDQTANFKDVTQLSVPVTIGPVQSSNWTMTASDLRDEQQSGRLLKAAKAKLAADIDVSISNTAGALGSLFVKRIGVATGFDDLAAADAMMTLQGIARNDRKCVIGPQDWNNMASTIAKPQTSANGNVNSAYERAVLPNIAGFDVMKADYVPSYAPAAGVTCTLTGALGYTPVASTLTPGIGSLNVDNRFQTVTIAVTSGTVKVGDAFTLGTLASNGAIACNHGTKTSTGQLKTFRVAAILTGAGGSGTISITPPIIPANGAANSQLQYANVMSAPTTGVPMTFLNNAVGGSFFNPFWQGDAMLIVPGKLVIPQGAGVQTMTATTANGFEVAFSKQTDIDNLATKYRVDIPYGTACVNPELAGVISFGNT